MKSITTIICLLLMLKAYAQKELEYQEGYVVLNSGDTLRGTVKDRDLGMFPSLLSKVSFKNERGRKKKFKITKIRAYGRGVDQFERFWMDITKERLITRYRSIQGQGEQMFLKVRYRGAIEHFEIEWVDEDDGQILSFPLLRKSGNAEFVRATQGVLGLKRKRLREYFADCRPLIRGINSGDVTSVEGIIEVYESRCAN